MSSPRRLVLLIAIVSVALGLPAVGRAQAQVLWPGVTYERGVQFTPNGPVAISILRGPRPGGTTTLEPLLSNESLLGRETAHRDAEAPGLHRGDRRCERRLLHARDRAAKRRPHARRRPREPTAQRPLERRHHQRRPARRPAHLVLRLLAGLGRAKHPVTAFNEVPEAGRSGCSPTPTAPSRPSFPARRWSSSSRFPRRCRTSTSMRLSVR